MNNVEAYEHLLDSPCGVIAERPIGSWNVRAHPPCGCRCMRFGARTHLIVTVLLLSVLALTVAFLAVVARTHQARGSLPQPACVIADATV